MSFSLYFQPDDELTEGCQHVSIFFTVFFQFLILEKKERYLCLKMHTLSSQDIVESSFQRLCA